MMGMGSFLPGILSGKWGEAQMKNALIYQTSEYDCGPTTLNNAVRYLFEREQITPEFLQNIYMYTLDAYNDDGESGKSGTSAMAMRFLSCWFNQYGEKKKFPIWSQFIEEEQVSVKQNGLITECLQQGGVAVAWVWIGDEGHYVLLIEIKDNRIGLFDPYYTDAYPENDKVKVVSEKNGTVNRWDDCEIMNSGLTQNYSFGSVEKRGAMLLYNNDTRKTPEKTIEYII